MARARLPLDVHQTSQWGLCALFGFAFVVCLVGPWPATTLMAEAAAATNAAAASDTKPDRPVNPDRVGEELADDANIWHVYDRIAREDDERRTKSWDNGLNNLALFAGLFSAVTTAFIIEAQQDMVPDYAQLTFLVLNATASGEKFVQRPFVIPRGARAVNCLWIASLILSLSAALIAIMGKDWIGMYTARPVCNLRQWAEMRTYRLRCVERWYMSGVIAAAPVLLHISLLLFGGGLVVFISDDPLLHHLTLGLCLAAGALYLVTTLSAIAFPASPFKSPATQMIRSAVATLFFGFRSVFARPKRNLVSTVLGAINAIVVPGADFSPTLPGHSPPDVLHQMNSHRWFPASLSASGRAFVEYSRSVYASLRVFLSKLQWSAVKQRLGAVASAARSLHLRYWFTSSTWTDLSVNRRPEHIADALSWLSGASQASDVLRALIFALGDLEIGERVAPLVSSELRVRVDSEIRHTLRHADFLTLSRQILAWRNLFGYRLFYFWDRFERFRTGKEDALPCEDGLAAAVILDMNPDGFARYCPEQVSQARMMEFLLPSISRTGLQYAQVVVVVANAYRSYLWPFGSFPIFQLEAEILRRLDPDTREAYASTVKAKFAGRPGAVELLTFLCLHDETGEDMRRSAIELIVHIVMTESSSRKVHPCLAYLLGARVIRGAVWTDRDWSSYQLYLLYFHLEPLLLAASPQDDGIETLDQQNSQLSLACSAVMMLSPRHGTSGFESRYISYLCAQIHQSEGRFTSDGTLDVIRLILEESALVKIVGRPDYLANDAKISLGTAILAETTRSIVQLLAGGTTYRDGKQLFERLAFSEARGKETETATWDLGIWIRDVAPRILEEFPSSSLPLADFHEAMASIYPLCASDNELRVVWDRIGYPGRPGDTFSDPFLDMGSFFTSAEAPRVGPGDTFGASSLDIAQFFEVAEAERNVRTD